MEHRRFLVHAEAHRPFVGGDLFWRIGGRIAVEAFIDGLYDSIETDAVLRPLFSRDLANEREAQKRFFAEWLGGDTSYSDCTHQPLKHRHDLLPITRSLAEKWLAHFSKALDSAVSDVEARRAIQDNVRALAMALVNEGAEPSALRARPHGTCLRYKPAIESVALARRGDAAALRQLVKRAPGVLGSAPHAARLLQLAVLGGREPVVEFLVDAGVDVNKPSPIEPLIFITHLCAARTKLRTEIEALLLRCGAKEDIFTHAFLGDLDRLHEDVGRDPRAVQAIDPAVDALQVTPVHHAVAGGRLEALRALLWASRRLTSRCSGVPAHSPERWRARTWRWSRCSSNTERAQRRSARAVGSSILSWRRCSRAAGRRSIDRDRGSGSHAPGTKDERMTPSMSRASYVTARVSRTSASRGRGPMAGEPRHSIALPRQAS